MTLHFLHLDERQRYLILYLKDLTWQQKEDLEKLKQESPQSSKLLISESEPSEVLRNMFSVEDSTLGNFDIQAIRI